MNHELAQKLLAMTDEDMRVRTEFAATGELFQGYAPCMADVHKRNAEVLEAIIEEHGWPGASLVGDDSERAAHLIVQHAIGCPGLQKRVLPLLAEAARTGEAEPTQAAYLHDRICFFERRPQRYGTQFDWDENGVMNPWKLEDPARVDEWRQSVGLGPLQEKINEAHEGTRNETLPDWAARLAEMEAWARSVGWIE